MKPTEAWAVVLVPLLLSGCSTDSREVAQVMDDFKKSCQGETVTTLEFGGWGANVSVSCREDNYAAD